MAARLQFTLRFCPHLVYHNPILIAGIGRRVIWVLTFQCAIAAIARFSSVVLAGWILKHYPLQ